MRRYLIFVLALLATATGVTGKANAASTYASGVLANPNLVGYWRLGEVGSQADAEGLIAADATGAHPGIYHQAVNLGVPGALEGDSDPAAHFGSPDGHVDIPYASALNPATFSVEAWVKFDSTTNYMRVTGTGAEYSDTSGFLLQTFPDYSNYAIAFEIGDGSAVHQLKGSDFTPGRWYYVAATYDGTTARLYVNGVLTSTLATGYSPNTSYPLRVGSSNVVSGSGQLAGSVDELALYNAALSATEIQQHYQAGIDDGVAPQTTIASAPSGLTNQTTAAVSFDSDSVDPTYQCQLDGAAWSPCSSPDTLTGLADGSHTLSVRAISRAGRIDLSPPSATWVVDTTPPRTSFSGGPARLTNSTDATFTFGSKPGATFTCSLDGEPASACSSPYTISGLFDGPHTLAVQATDPAGNVELSPATYAWTVDTAPPSTLVLSGPSAQAPSAALQFIATKSTVAFRCALDGGRWQPCTSPLGRLPQTAGTHTVQIQAIDSAGNVEPSPATYTWTVLSSGTQTQPPTLALRVAFPRVVRSAAAQAARVRAAAKRCGGKAVCITRARQRLKSYVQWSVGKPAALSLVIDDVRGRRVGGTTLMLRGTHGAVALPPRLLARLRPGRYTAVLQATAGGLRSRRLRHAFAVRG